MVSRNVGTRSPGSFASIGCFSGSGNRNFADSSLLPRRRGRTRHRLPFTKDYVPCGEVERTCSCRCRCVWHVSLSLTYPWRGGGGKGGGGVWNFQPWMLARSWFASVHSARAVGIVGLAVSLYISGDSDLAKVMLKVPLRVSPWDSREAAKRNRAF